VSKLSGNDMASIRRLFAESCAPIAFINMDLFTVCAIASVVVVLIVIVVMGWLR